jgi:hypothetical protein
MTVALPDERPARLATGLARAASLATAGAISFALMLDPYILNGVSAFRVHAGLPLLMLGASSAFAYGLAFRPSGRITRVLLHPALAWTLLGAGAALMALK